MRRKKSEVEIEKIFKGKKIPILTLDSKWHDLFPDNNKPPHIKELEDKVNKLLKDQGRLVSDMKAMKELKSKLMNEILEHMDADNSRVGKLKAKKLDRNQKLIKDLSSKMSQTEDELIELPYQIKEVNEQLIIESAKVCYARIKDYKESILSIDEWIIKTRDELKEKLILKQDMEQSNTIVYSYMHDLLGPELLQELDELL